MVYMELVSNVEDAADRSSQTLADRRTHSAARGAASADGFLLGYFSKVLGAICKLREVLIDVRAGSGMCSLEGHQGLGIFTP